MWKLQINAELSCKWIVCSQFKEWCYLKLKKKTTLPRSAKRNISDVIQMEAHPVRPKKVGSGWSWWSHLGLQTLKQGCPVTPEATQALWHTFFTWTWATYILKELNQVFQWSKERRLHYRPWASTNRSSMCAEGVQDPKSTPLRPQKTCKVGCACAFWHQEDDSLIAVGNCCFSLPLNAETNKTLVTWPASLDQKSLSCVQIQAPNGHARMSATFTIFMTYLQLLCWLCAFPTTFCNIYSF